MSYISQYRVAFSTYCEQCEEFCYKFYNKQKCKNCMKIVYRVDTDKPIFFEEREEIKEVKEEMDEHDYDYLIEEIKNASIHHMAKNIPNLVQLPTEQVKGYTDGYLDCYDYILGIIIRINESNSQGR